MCFVLISEISETPKTDRRFLTELLFSLYTNVLLLESSNKSKYIEVKHSEFSDFKILRHLGENVTVLKFTLFIFIKMPHFCGTFF